MMMITMSLTFLVSDWGQQLYNPEGIRKSIGAPRSQFSRKSGLMIQDSKTLDIDKTPIHTQIPSFGQFQGSPLQCILCKVPYIQGR